MSDPTDTKTPAGATETPNTITRQDLAPVRLFDTTLRDGEQCPGASMTFDEKLEVADMLDAMKMDIIEAGFPIASEGDFKAVEAIAKRVKNASVCALSRAVRDDIDRAGQAVKGARAPRIHTFISTSPIHREFKLGKDKEQVLEAITDSVTRARQFTDDVQWSPEDATRTEKDFLCKAVDQAIKAGATTINIPDTVGYCLPQEYGDLIRLLLAQVPSIDKVVLSCHCHNDLGLAVANSLAGLEAGVRQVEGTINGIGERAGNAALEEIIMAIRTRAADLPFALRADTRMIARASRLVSKVTSFPVQYNKAIVGANAFAHESGIHQHGMLKHAETYEIMRPESVGIKKTSLVMGKHSGRHAFRDKLVALNYHLGTNAFEDAFQRFKALADRKKIIYDEDIEALIDYGKDQNEGRIAFKHLTVIAGNEGPQEARLTLQVDGVERSATCQGNGPVDSAFSAIRSIAPHDFGLELYQVSAVTEGTDAQAEVSVRLSDQTSDLLATGRAANPDTLVASVQAYVRALNRIHARAERKPVVFAQSPSAL